MTTPYVKQKLRATVDGMAVGRGHLRERLANVWGPFHVLKAEDFDDPVDREMFERIYHDLTVIPGAAPGSVHSCVAAMTEEKLEQTARDIVELASRAAQE